MSNFNTPSQKQKICQYHWTGEFSPIQYDPNNPGSSPGASSEISESPSLMIDDPVMQLYELSNEEVYGGLYEKLTKTDEDLRIIKELGLHQFTWTSIVQNPTNNREHREQMLRFWEIEKMLVRTEVFFSTLKKSHGITRDLQNLHAGYKALISNFIELAENIPAQAGMTFERGTDPAIQQCLRRDIVDLPITG